MTWRAYGDFRAPFEGRAFVRYALRLADESERREVYRVLVTEYARAGMGVGAEASYMDLVHQQAPAREKSIEEIIEGAGLEVTHEPA